MQVRRFTTSVSCLLVLFLLISMGQFLLAHAANIPFYKTIHSTIPLVSTKYWWQMSYYQPSKTDMGGQKSYLRAPELSIEPYVRPEFAAYIDSMQPYIIAAAKRHNRPIISEMSDEEFAQVIALLLYNEHNGWVEDDIEALRPFTPLYQGIQQVANEHGLGTNFSVWPSNLRPSVALEILNHQIPVPSPTYVITIPLQIAGSQIDVQEYDTQPALYADITKEITDDELAIEYLAVNLERGLYRAAYEGVPVSWRTLAAWHNQGIVRPEQIRANDYARDYVRRTAAYLDTAYYLIMEYKSP